LIVEELGVIVVLEIVEAATTVPTENNRASARGKTSFLEFQFFN
jgi:hypothetical protein